jgi:2-(1,2-epoxy-1,2-dihydrophenyl)acetyl-CoA isomerase
MEMQDRRPVICRSAAGITTCTLTRKALDRATKEALVDAVRAAAADDAVRAVVLTGTGTVFCAGQDLDEHHGALTHGAQAAFATVTEHYNPLVTTLATMAKPVLCAINGACAGAGLGLALACDLRVAAASARFTTAFTAIGLSVDSGLSASLARAVGLARASELVLRSEPFTADQAMAWGLVGQVVPDEELTATVDALATRLAAGPTRAYAAAKAALRRAWVAPWPELLAAEADDQIALGATDDHRRAVAAFRAKERPTFTGR